MATTVNPGHFKIGVCAGAVYAASSLIVPRLMPGSTLARVFNDRDLFAPVGVKTVMCAVLGSYVATALFGVQVVPPAGGFGFGFF